MPIGETIPTIGELKGNTILELFKNGYNALKNALTRKQNKLIAGDNIVIDEDTNRISAIEGGTPVLDDYYTKTETDDLLDEKANAVNTYDKEEVDDLLADKADIADVYDKTETYTKTEVDNLINGDCEIITPTIIDDSNGLKFDYELKKGDIIVCEIINDSYVLEGTYVGGYCKGIEPFYNYKTSSTGIKITSTDANNFSMLIYKTFIYNYQNNEYIIRAMEYTLTVTNGATSISSHTYRDGVKENSKITIYRKKEEIQ